MVRMPTTTMMMLLVVVTIVEDTRENVKEEQIKKGLK